MEVRRLPAPPHQRVLLARALLSAIRGPQRRAGQVPDLEVRLDAVTIDFERLAAYDRVCGFRLTDTLPATYPHVLATPPSLLLMTDPAFPFPLPGTIHIGNRIRQHRPIRADERLSVAVRAENLRPHRAGTQVDVMLEVRTGSELVWEEASTHLSRHRNGEGIERSGHDRRDIERVGQPRPGREDAAIDPVAVWHIGADVGRRYAAVSADHNPIHVSRLGARLFGFRRPIAHGMWTAARVLAALEGMLPPSYIFDVEFKRPLLLPARVTFAMRDRSAAGIRVEVRDAATGRPHLLGDVTAT